MKLLIIVLAIFYLINLIQCKNVQELQNFEEKSQLNKRNSTEGKCQENYYYDDGEIKIYMDDCHELLLRCNNEAFSIDSKKKLNELPIDIAKKNMDIARILCNTLLIKYDLKKKECQKDYIYNDGNIKIFKDRCHEHVIVINHIGFSVEKKTFKNTHEEYEYIKEIRKIAQLLSNIEELKEVDMDTLEKY